MYLHSKNPDMMGLLRWAEQQKDPVTAHSLGAARRNSGPLARLAEDPEVLSYHLWGFLNVSLTDDAWAIFSGVDIENCFEVWRIVVVANTTIRHTSNPFSISTPENMAHASSVKLTFRKPHK